MDFKPIRNLLEMFKLNCYKSYDKLPIKLNIEEVKHGDGTCAKFSEPVPKIMTTAIKNKG